MKNIHLNLIGKYIFVGFLIWCLLSGICYSQETKWEVGFRQPLDSLIYEKFESNTLTIHEILLEITKRDTSASDFTLLIQKDSKNANEYTIIPDRIETSANSRNFRIDEPELFSVKIIVENDELNEVDKRFTLMLKSGEDFISYRRKEQSFHIINADPLDRLGVINPNQDIAVIKSHQRIPVYRYIYSNLRGKNDEKIYDWISNSVYEPSREQLENIYTTYVKSLNIRIENGIFKHFQVETIDGTIYENRRNSFSFTDFYKDKYKNSYLVAVNHNEFKDYPKAPKKKSIRSEFEAQRKKYKQPNIDSDSLTNFMKTKNIENQETKEYLFIHPWEVIDYKSIGSGKYYPDNITFTLPDSSGSNSINITVNPNIENFINAEIFTDILGLANDANGLVQTELSTLFIWNTHPLGNSWTTYLNFVKPFFKYSKYDGTAIDDLKLAENSSIDRLDLLRVADFSAGAEINIIRKNRVDDFYINIGYEWYQTNSIIITETTDNNPTIQQQGTEDVSHSSYYLKLGTNFFRGANYGIDLSFSSILHKIAQNSTLTDRKHKLIFKPSGKIFWNPIGQNKLFFRFTPYFSGDSDAKNSYVNIQFGTQISFNRKNAKNLFSN